MQVVAFDGIPRVEELEELSAVDRQSAVLSYVGLKYIAVV